MRWAPGAGPGAGARGSCGLRSRHAPAPCLRVAQLNEHHVFVSIVQFREGYLIFSIIFFRLTLRIVCGALTACFRVQQYAFNDQWDEDTLARAQGQCTHLRREAQERQLPLAGAHVAAACGARVRCARVRESALGARARSSCLPAAHRLCGVRAASLCAARVGVARRCRCGERRAGRCNTPRDVTCLARAGLGPLQLTYQVGS